MSDRPAQTYLIVTQGVDQMLADLAGNDIERVAYQIARAAFLQIRAIKGPRLAAEKAYSLADEFGGER